MFQSRCLNTGSSDYDSGFLTCPANIPHSAVQSVSEEQPDCSDTQPAANSLQKSLHSPTLIQHKKKKCYTTHSVEQILSKF